MEYIARVFDSQLERDLVSWPAVLITGPRAVGKTTSGMRLAGSVLRLDSREDRSYVDADPDFALKNFESAPLFIDEWQLVPDVLSSIKRIVDDDSSVGQFIVTGSSRNDYLADFWPATGRLINLKLWPLVGRELFGDASAESLFDRWDSNQRWFKPSKDVLTLRDYVDLALKSGFPSAIDAVDESARRRWFRTYINDTITRDLGPIEGSGQRRKNPQSLKDFLNAYAVHSSGVTSDQSIYESAGIARKTFLSYHSLFTSVGLIQDINAWRSNYLRRLTATPKRYVIDAGLMASLIKVNTSSILRNASLRGSILDTFITAQLRVEAEVSKKEVNLFHLRTEQGEHEVDLLVEVDGKIIGFEYKASDSPKSSDAKHLKWLKEQIGDLFIGGVVFHTGKRKYQIDENIDAVPIAHLWG